MILALLVLACTGAAAGTIHALAAATAPAQYHGLRTSNSYTPLAPAGTQPATQQAASSPAANSISATGPAPAPLRDEGIPDDLRRRFLIDAFYTRGLVLNGIPIIGSDKVSDYAFLECACTLDHMLAGSPPFVRDALLTARTRVGIISVAEYTMDIPENQTRQNMQPGQAAYQDRRSRGLGGLPLATCAEENLLNLRSDPYTAENITIHEFSHTVASSVRRLNPAWYQKLRDTYDQAMKEGLFASSYSATNEQEYWAEGAQAWFDCAAQRKDATVHSGIWNREQLKAYDPRLAALLAEIYGDGPWRYVKTNVPALRVGGQVYTRTPAELAHLAGLDRSLLPAFDFNNSPRIRAAQTRPAGN